MSSLLLTILAVLHCTLAAYPTFSDNCDKRVISGRLWNRSFKDGYKTMQPKQTHRHVVCQESSYFEIDRNDKDHLQVQLPSRMEILYVKHPKISMDDLQEALIVTAQNAVNEPSIGYSCRKVEVFDENEQKNISFGDAYSKLTRRLHPLKTQSHIHCVDFGEDEFRVYDYSARRLSLGVPLGYRPTLNQMQNVLRAAQEKYETDLRKSQ